VGKKVAAAPLAEKKAEPKKVVNPLFEKRQRNFGIGKMEYAYKFYFRKNLVHLFQSDATVK
jgi:hypothetical protein